MTKRPLEFWGLMSAGAASITAILGAIFIALDLLYRLFTSDWDSWSFLGMLKPLIPATLLVFASLVLMFIQSHSDVVEEDRNNPFK